MQARRSRRAPVRRRGLNMTRVVMAGLVFIAAIFAGMVTAKRLADPHFSLMRSLIGFFTPVPAPQALFHKSRLRVLLLGLDYNYTDQDIEYSAAARSDTIMALSLDLPTHSLHVLSVPRDMKYTFLDGHSDKINAAYSLGGPHAAERAVAQFLGLPGFDRYVVLRLDATKSLIDAIGGIDVPVTEAMNYDDSWGHLHIHFVPGLQHMNGEQAVSYSRFRHDACSDPCRIQRQQQVLRITIEKLRSNPLNDFAHLSALLDVVNQNVQTDLSTTEKMSLVKAYADFSMKSLQTDQIPYVSDQVLPNAGDVLLPDEAAKAKLVQRLFLDPVSGVGAHASATP